MGAALFERAAIERYPDLAAWQAEASELVSTTLRRWELTPGSPFVGGVSGSVLAVTRRDGSPAVLKVGFPHGESVWEAVGVESLGEGLAPRLIEQDAWTWAMLLDPVLPGVPLSHAPLAPAQALGIGGEVAARVHDTAVPDGLPSLTSAMQTYAADARPRLRHQETELARLGVLALVVDAIDLLEERAADAVAPRFLHGDFNPGNVLEGSSGWRVVDPNPLVGDPAYDLWPLVSQLGRPAEASDLAALLERQLRLAADASGIDAARAADWGFARSGLDVNWYLDDGDARQAGIAARQVRAWASVAGR